MPHHPIYHFCPYLLDVARNTMQSDSSMRLCGGVKDAINVQVTWDL